MPLLSATEAATSPRPGSLGRQCRPGRLRCPPPSRRAAGSRSPRRRSRRRAAGRPPRPTHLPRSTTGPVLPRKRKTHCLAAAAWRRAGAGEAWAARGAAMRGGSSSCCCCRGRGRAAARGAPASTSHPLPGARLPIAFKRS
eukprot:scaffold760_cov372-Prasinococcus_capsulatus_cf.AAC.8